jgi:hypothetical protein
MFRKKPVVIEAVQFTDSPQNTHDILSWVGDRAHVRHDGAENGEIVIQTLEGDHLARVGDWIIKGVAGEFYPCKPNIFAATYEPADTPSAPSPEAAGDWRNTSTKTEDGYNG